MVTRRRTASKIHSLPPKVVPLNVEDEQKAVTALADMIDWWWYRHRREEAMTPDTDQPHPDS
jgi:hypothetical protein